jgi:hypothetical protein
MLIIFFLSLLLTTTQSSPLSMETPIFFGQPTQNGVVAYSQMVVPSTTRIDNESKGEKKRYFIYTVRYQLEKTGEA